MTFDENRARMLRDEGMAQAVGHADRVDGTWSNRATALFHAYVAAATAPFTTEAVRRWAETQGLAEPPDRRAWGAITRSLVIAKRIVRDGYVAHKDPVRHHGISSLWRKA